MRRTRALIGLAAAMALAAALTGAGRPPKVALGPTPPTFIVNSVGDAIAANPLDNGICETVAGNPPESRICTLRAAVMKANHWPGGGATIIVPAGEYILYLAPTGADDETSGDLNLTASMTIAGAGAASTFVDGNATDRVFYVDATGPVFISGLTLRNGAAEFDGGAIYQVSPLTIDRSAIIGNRAVDGLGGGIAAVGLLTVTNSLIRSNRSSNTGGGIWSNVSLVLDNSTVSNNASVNDGGGIRIPGGTASVYFSTVAGNLGDSDASGDYGGGISVGLGSLSLRGTLLADNLAGGGDNDCNGTLTSLGYNLVQTSNLCTIAPATGDQIDADAYLESLGDNGGALPTRALLETSQALDAVPAEQCLDRFAVPLTTDQRGFPRPEGGACDVGAFEGSLAASFYNRNLIRNGDAELAAGAEVATAFIGLAGWPGYDATVIAYGSPADFPTLSSPGPSDRGESFFTGGYNQADTGASQFIDVSAIAADIDAGLVRYEFSGYFGGVGSQDDMAELKLEFYGGGVIDTVTIGQVTAAERGNVTGLLFQQYSGLVPAGTIELDFSIRFVRFGGTFNDGYADNLSLVLHRPNVYLPVVLY